MGGFGSGRQFGADCTSDYRSIDVRRLQRDGLITPGRYFNWQWSRNGELVANINVQIENDHLRLIYRSQEHGSEWQQHDYKVRLETTPCNYGGKRYWFICPALGCGKRVAILYGGKIFACRHCYQLVYASQRESDHDRASRRADSIRNKLQWEPGILNGSGWKPKGMHWQNYHRLVAIHDDYVHQSLMGIAAKLKIVLTQ